MAGLRVPGFDIDALIGRGWGGELWSARGRATGRRVVLRRLAVSDDVANHDRVRQAAARLVGVQHPHLVRLRGVLSAEGAVVLVHDHEEGVGLDRLLAEHRALTAAEVVTLAVPLAQALAAVHACGLVHGRVSPASVLLSDDGRPMLADTGVAALIGARDRGSPHDDVRDLALTCLAVLDPAARHGPLADVLSAATADDASRRPGAAELAAAVFATGSAAPIQPSVTPGLERDPAPHIEGPPRSHRRTPGRPIRRAPRRWAPLLVAVGAAMAAALSGLAWAGVDTAAPGSNVAVREPPTSYDVSAVSNRWRLVLVALDARRASAYAASSPRRLADVYATDSPALRRDRARLAELAATGLHVERLHLRARSVRVVTSSPRRVVLAVVDVLDPYAVRTARGALVAARPGRGAAAWRVTLVRERTDWRVYDVVAS